MSNFWETANSTEYDSNHTVSYDRTSFDSSIVYD